MLDLVTDRTQADVDAWRAGGTNTKGEYKHTDLNRVGAAMHTLALTLAGYGIDVPITAKTDWDQAGIYTKDDLDQMLTEIQLLLDSIAALEARLSTEITVTALPDSARWLTYAKANDIEKVLLEIDSVLSHVSARQATWADVEGDGRTWDQVESTYPKWFDFELEVTDD